jgi:hypothetical protein
VTALTGEATDRMSATDDARRSRTLADLSTLVDTVLLARAAAGDGLSDEILDTAPHRHFLKLDQAIFTEPIGTETLVRVRTTLTDPPVQETDLLAGPR